MTETLNVNREYKDSLFRCIFGQNDPRSKRWRLDLYNALNNSSYTDPDELELTTIEDVIYISIKNDLSFLVDCKMNLIEQQSTFNPNMPLRGLMYFSLLYQLWLSDNKKDLYGSTVVRIPAPQYIVFYNGEREMSDRVKLRLSDAFMTEDRSGDFEWTATMFNINEGHNDSLGKKCKSLYHYVSYISRVRQNLRSGMNRKEAISEAVDWAIKENLLDGFFREEKAKVIAVSLTEFDEELFIRNRHQEGYEEGKADGIAQGMEQGSQSAKSEAAKSLYANGVSVEVIAKSLGMSVEEVNALIQDA